MAASGEAEAVHDRQARYFLTLVVRFVPDQGRYLAWSVIDRLERDYDNIRQALRWLLTRDDREPAVRLATALGPFWHHQGYHREGRQWLAGSLERAAGVAPAVRAAALIRASVMAMYLADFPSALAWAKEARSIYEALGQRRGEADALLVLGNVHLRATDDHQDYAQARALIEGSLALYQAEQERSGMGTALHCLGMIAYYQGDLARSRQLQQQSLALRRELGPKRPIAISANWLGHVAVAEGALAEARALYTEGLTLHRELHSAPFDSLSLSCFANLAAAQGQTRRAIRLGAAALALAEPLGIQGWTTTQAGIDKRVEAIGATLPAAEQEAAWAEGQAMTLEEALAYALTEEPDPVA